MYSKKVNESWYEANLYIEAIKRVALDKSGFKYEDIEKKIENLKNKGWKP
ncbi:MAG: hypothetical protein ACOC33_02890 [bacterium]